MKGLKAIHAGSLPPKASALEICSCRTFLKAAERPPLPSPSAHAVSAQPRPKAQGGKSAALLCFAHSSFPPRNNATATPSPRITCKCQDSSLLPSSPSDSILLPCMSSVQLKAPAAHTFSSTLSPSRQVNLRCKSHQAHFLPPVSQFIVAQHHTKPTGPSRRSGPPRAPQSVATFRPSPARPRVSSRLCLSSTRPRRKHLHLRLCTPPSEPGANTACLRQRLGSNAGSQKCRRQRAARRSSSPPPCCAVAQPLPNLHPSSLPAAMSALVNSRVQTALGE